MSLKKHQELLILLKKDEELKNFGQKLIEFFTNYPFLTFTFLSRELDKETNSISELLRPFRKSKLIIFKYELECPECFCDVKIEKTPKKLLVKEIVCPNEMCGCKFEPNENDILVKIYPTNSWQVFTGEFFRTLQRAYTITH